jgi:hypothetical protein
MALDVSKYMVALGEFYTQAGKWNSAKNDAEKLAIETKILKEKAQTLMFELKQLPPGIAGSGVIAHVEKVLAL